MLASFVVRSLQSSFTGRQALTFKSKTVYRWEISRWCSARSLGKADAILRIVADKAGEVLSDETLPGREKYVAGLVRELLTDAFIKKLLS
jgi:hypothetical protein